MTPTKLLCLCLLAAGAAAAAPQRYEIEPGHTYPSFEADHMGISVWRGKFNKSSGTVMLDKTAGTGSIDITIDPASIDFGHDELNEWAIGKNLLETAKFPQATYKGKLMTFVGGKPTRVDGELTLHGVKKPVALDIQSFRCVEHPMFKGRELCGADALGTIRRDEFGLDAGKDYHFDMRVTLRIQVEALQPENAAPKATQ